VACIRVGVGAAVNVGGQVTVGGGRCGLANNGQEPLGHGTGRVLDPALSCGFCVESPAGIEPATHPSHSCCRAPVIEGAEVKRSGVSVADRGEPEASCSAWHADGTAGKDDHAWHLAAKAQARAMGEARPR